MNKVSGMHVFGNEYVFVYLSKTDMGFPSPFFSCLSISLIAKWGNPGVLEFTNPEFEAAIALVMATGTDYG